MELICETADERHIPVLFSVHEVALARTYSQRVIGLGHGEKIFDKATSDLDESSIDHIYGFGGAETAVSARQ
jgi:phosphonate transport system ATP-binding protein